MLKKLPLGRSSFANIRKLDCLYVDKTKYAYDLITGGWRYFLSRPRRFGKSLFVSTLEEILQGNKELFSGLWIEKSDYQWAKHAVISLDFTTLNIKSIDFFEESLVNTLKLVGIKYEVQLIAQDTSIKSVFMELIEVLHKKYAHVAILIDEYDSPILQTLKNKKYASQIRDVIRDFSYVIKSSDKYIDFVFITGVSSFARAGIFSGLNNLKILTLNDKYGATLGYTDNEIDLYFKDYIQAWSKNKNIEYADLRESIKKWYNGYRFGQDVDSVYNPFSLMNALEEKALKNFWFQSGTPTFLIDELTKEYRKKECEIFDVDTIGEVTELTLGSFDVGMTPLVTLMFQTGYVTISSYDSNNQAYTLKYPNYETQTALQKYLLAAIIESDITIVDNVSLRLRKAFEAGNLDVVIDSFRRLFSTLPYYLHDYQEKYYHGILHVICNAAGLKTQAEYLTSHGRIDLIVDMPAKLYIFEVKLNESAQVALEQIEKNKYYEPFVDYAKPIELVGIAFRREPKKFEISYVSKNFEV